MTFADTLDDALRSYEQGQFQQAMRLWRGLAMQENAEAQYRLGLLHESGLGVTRCNAGAFDWYLRSARNGHPRAQSALARMYEHGLSVARNRSEADKWARMSGTTRVASADGADVPP
jgi:TPR repeat protein